MERVNKETDPPTGGRTTGEAACGRHSSVQQMVLIGLEAIGPEPMMTKPVSLASRLRCLVTTPEERQAASNWRNLYDTNPDICLILFMLAGSQRTRNNDREIRSGVFSALTATLMSNPWSLLTEQFCS